MPPKRDIGWEFCEPIGEGRKNVKCKFCNKVITGGITRLKQHIARVSGNVETCTKAPDEIRKMLKKNMQDSKIEREIMKRKKEVALNAIRDETYNAVDSDCENDYNEDDLQALEAKQLRNAMRESRQMAFTEEMSRQYGAGNPGASTSKTGVKREISRSQSSRGFDSSMRAPKQKSIKHWFAPQKIKSVGKAVSKFFFFNAIPFNAADSGPYYQGMIDIIAEAGPGIKGPSGRQIGGMYLDEEVDEIDIFLTTLKAKAKEYGCTVMCDGWSSRNKHPIINFMVYCDRQMIFIDSFDCTNLRKTADLMVDLMNKIIDAIGEENVVQVVTDSESAMKSAGHTLMLERPHCIELMLEDMGEMKKIKKVMTKAKQITSFIYNSEKLVNLMKIYTNDRELLRPGITRFATEFIAIESLIRHQSDLKKMCTSQEWEDYNVRRRKDAEKVYTIIMDIQFWKKAKEVQCVMEPLVKVLKLVDQDKKPTLAIIYEAMDKAKLAIKETVKDWQLYWEVIDERWYRQLHQHLHAAAYFLNPVLQYSGTCAYTDEVRQGLKTVIKRLEPNLEAQSHALNELKTFRDKAGEFGTPLAKRAINTMLPSEWWMNFGEETPHLRKIAIKVLSQTCSSTGCERNWSTWSLIHTKIRNRLAMEKLKKLVYCHYNMRLRVRNLMHNKNDTYYDLPIDLNQIFQEDDILDEWTRENEEPILDNDTERLDNEIQNIQSTEDDENLTINDWRRKTKKCSQTLKKQEKGKSTQTSSQANDSDTGSDEDTDDGTNDGGDNQGPNVGGGSSGGQMNANMGGSSNQDNTGMSWARGDENYYATQDTDHGYCPGREEKQRFLADLSSGNDYSYPTGSFRRSYQNVDEQMQSLGLREYRQNWRDENANYINSYDSGSTGSHVGSSGLHYDYSSHDINDRTHRNFDQGFSDYNRYLEPLTFSGGYGGSSYGSFGMSRGSSDSSGSSIGYRGFGYYGHGGDHIPYPQPSYPNIREYMQRQFRNSSEERDNSDVLPPRHSTYY